MSHRRKKALPRKAAALAPKPGRPSEGSRWLLWLLGAGAAAAVGFLVWLNLQQSPGDGPARPDEVPGMAEGKDFPVPPYSESRFLNTGPEARYIGTDACASCHRDKHASYLLTAHSRSLADVDPGAEPHDGAFVHPASGRSYRVYRQDGRLRHEEVLRTAEGKEVARQDLPVRYLVGSGRFSRTYLVEVDGFLHESPITWYASKQQWGVSPGYDTPHHWGFERGASIGCLSCHTGRADPAGTVHHTTIREKAIGCENCHGPGSLHADFHRSGKRLTGTDDPTIVHPGKLSRPLLEAVCAACHLNGPATVSLRGRQTGSFRPGRPLTDYRIDYRFDRGSEQMTVVGHMEQLRQSACYQKSRDLTCLTCHDPHAAERPKDPTAFYREKCLSCHTAASCRLEKAERLKKDAADSCAACHMPRGDTDIPHLAFTHHRIGRHSPKPAADLVQTPELVPTDDVSHLEELDQKRNLGLAYLEAARNPTYSRYVGPFSDRARDLLEGVHKAGLREGATAEGLAALYLKTDPARSRAYARQAVAAEGASAEVRAMALIHLAACEMEDRRYESAVGLAKELVRLRRGSEEWGLLGMAYLLQDQPREALPALQQALAIRPDSRPVHAGLAEAYRRLGDAPRAREHQEKAQWLLQHGSE